MASISKRSNGRKVIQFTGADRKRRTLRLGKVSMRTAGVVKSHVENSVAASITEGIPADETSRWVSRLDSDMAD